MQKEEEGKPRLSHDFRLHKLNKYFEFSSGLSWSTPVAPVVNCTRQHKLEFSEHKTALVTVVHCILKSFEFFIVFKSFKQIKNKS